MDGVEGSSGSIGAERGFPVEMVSSSPIKEESIDMRERGLTHRERGLTVNPMLVMPTSAESPPQDGGGGSEDADDNALESIESQQRPHRARSMLSIAGLRDDWHSELSNSSAMVRFILLFSGVAPPPSQYSPWMLCRVGWPLVVVFGAVLEVGYVLEEFEHNAGAVAYMASIPTMVGMVVALDCYRWLWKKAHTLIAEEAPLPPEQLRSVGKVSWVFTAVWMVAGFGMYVWELADPQFKEASLFASELPVIAVNWIALTAIVPVLSATLLVLGIETTHATNTTEALLQAARDKTLTRGMYTAARHRIKERSQSWTRTLGVLFVVALYNTIGMVMILHDPQVDHHFDNIASEDVYHVVLLGKQTALLFVILIDVVRVNNAADAMITVLNSEPWGEPGSKKESIRQDLLWLTTSTSITPEATTSFWLSITTPKSKPISFKVCGIRPARDTFIAAAASLVFSILGSVVRSYQYSHNETF